METAQTRPERLCFSELGMSNFDHVIDEGLEEQLRAGEHCAQHSAWDFCGYVWFEDGQFYEEVWRFHQHVATLSADDLRELMEAVNDEYGPE